MKRIEDIIPPEFPVGGGIGHVLQENPLAVDFAMDTICAPATAADSELTAEEAAATMVFDDFSSWFVVQMPHPEDPLEAKHVVRRAMLAAFAVAQEAHPDYSPGVQISPYASDDNVHMQYLQVVTDATRAGTAYPELIGAGERMQALSDPEERYGFYRQLGTLAAFTMISYHDMQQLWHQPQHGQLEAISDAQRDDEIAALEAQFRAA